MALHKGTGEGTGQNRTEEGQEVDCAGGGRETSKGRVKKKTELLARSSASACAYGGWRINKESSSLLSKAGTGFPVIPTFCLLPTYPSRLRGS